MHIYFICINESASSMPHKRADRGETMTQIRERDREIDAFLQFGEVCPLPTPPPRARGLPCCTPSTPPGTAPNRARSRRAASPGRGRGGRWQRRSSGMPCRGCGTRLSPRRERGPRRRSPFGTVRFGFVTFRYGSKDTTKPTHTRARTGTHVGNEGSNTVQSSAKPYAGEKGVR